MKARGWRRQVVKIKSAKTEKGRVGLTKERKMSKKMYITEGGGGWRGC